MPVYCINMKINWKRGDRPIARGCLDLSQGRKMTFFTVFADREGAEKILKDNGLKPAPHHLLDAYLVDEAETSWKTYSGVSPSVMIVREVLAYPTNGGLFKKGQDIVDAKTGLRVPLSSLRDLDVDIYQKGTGLYITPKEGVEERGVVHPKSIVVVHNLAHSNYCRTGSGVVDPLTKMPIEKEGRIKYPNGRMHQANEHESVGSIVRMFPSPQEGNYGLEIRTNYFWQENGVGVGYPVGILPEHDFRTDGAVDAKVVGMRKSMLAKIKDMITSVLEKEQ